VRITGITNETLRGQTDLFTSRFVDRLMEFLGDDPVVAHKR